MGGRYRRKTPVRLLAARLLWVDRKPPELPQPISPAVARVLVQCPTVPLPVVDHGEDGSDSVT